MRCLTIIIVFTLFFGKAYSQQDTLYVLFKNNAPNLYYQLCKHIDDLETRNHFPFDGGKHYYIPKKDGKYKYNLVFYYSSHTPDWMDFKFYFEVVDRTIIEQKKLKIEPGLI